ncbi:MAG: STAS domain-containing protein [Rhodanobacter sp.]
MSNAGSFDLDTRSPATLGVRGELTFDNAAAALLAISAALVAGNAVRLDLVEVRHCDSAGLACVLAVAAEAGRRGAPLQVSGMPAGMRALARVCEVDRLLLG